MYVRTWLEAVKFVASAVEVMMGLSEIGTVKIGRDF